MRSTRVIILVECALAVALAVVLNLIAIRLPINIAGGSISLTMLPVALVALRRGPVAGMATGFLFGLFDYLIEPFMVHWAQVILDYPLPYILFGLGVGMFSHLYTRAIDLTKQDVLGKTLSRGTLIIVVSMIVGGILRYASHVLSGVIFFSEYAGGENVWIYSLVYNVSYLLPSLVASLVLMLVIAPILAHAVPVSRDGGQQRSV